MSSNELTTPQSAVSFFESNKLERRSFVDGIITSIVDGDADPLKIQYGLKCMEDIFTQLTSLDEKKNKNIEAARTYRKQLLEAAEKYGKKFDLFSASFSIIESGTKYDYSVCQDVVYNEMVSEMEGLKEKMKEREKFLQTIPEEGIADPVNGNMIYRATKSSTTSLSVSLK